MTNLTTSPKTVVHWNPRMKQWTAVNGSVRQFGSGKDAKRDCLLYALDHDHPHLAGAVKSLADEHPNNPQLLDRLIKGAMLICKGHITTLSPNRWQVRSQSEPGETYQVVFSHGGYACQCQDFENGLKRRAGLERWGGAEANFNDAPVCKHI
jgi:hypothetical protein